MDQKTLTKIAALIRSYILTASTEAGSGHPTSSLSATDLMTALMFGRAENGDPFFRYDIADPQFPNNDRLIFSKGHASPLFYALWAAGGAIEADELLTYRKFGSRLEGHPTLNFPYTEAATGSLGQGLSIGVGMALNAKLDALPYRTFVLLGDSEMAEGSIWEAMASAAHYKLDNLIAIADINRLGQRGETMHGHDLGAYARKAEAFGWNVITMEDGHDIGAAIKAYREAQSAQGKPSIIIAHTLKGKGVSFLEDKDGWHGKALSREELKKALEELGDIDKNIRGEIASPTSGHIPNSKTQIPDEKNIQDTQYEIHDTKLATRKVYGKSLIRIAEAYPHIVVLDAEVSNSTYSEDFKKAYPERFFEMFIAEQNMAGAAIGFSRRGKKPFVSTFAAFFTRACDQIRMAQYSGANITFVGSHAGVSIGEDGASQMGLEDLAMFRSIHQSTVLYPSDAVSADKLIEEAAKYDGITYIRTTRADTPILYGTEEVFPIGGSKTLRQSDNDMVTVIGAGITLHEALAAHEALAKEGIAVRVIDLYSIKPLDVDTLRNAAQETNAIITVEDHYPEGGIGEAVARVLSGSGTPFHALAVEKMPRSGTPQELLDYEAISKDAIIKKVKEVTANH